jgi:hypothetical protein
VFEANRGAGISSVAIGSQNDVTYTATVTIEPGDAPLYLVLVALRPMVWQVEGAVGRITKVVLASNSRHEGTAIPVGVTGLSREIVAFADGSGCAAIVSGITRQTFPGMAAQREVMLASFKRLVGREPDAAMAAEEVWKLKLPSGQVEGPPPPSDKVDPSLSALVFARAGKGDFTYVLLPGSRVRIGPVGTDTSITIESPEPSAVDDMREELALWHTAGLVGVDPAAVVSPAPVAPYELLPLQAGMIQLLESGAIERNGVREYLIKRKIRIPAGIEQKFLLLKGVPPPEGGPSRSTVFSEDTGDFICAAARCP